MLDPPLQVPHEHALPASTSRLLTQAGAASRIFQCAPKRDAAQAQKSHLCPPSWEQKGALWAPSKGHVLPGPCSPPSVSLDLLPGQEEGAAFPSVTQASSEAGVVPSFR